MHLRNEQINTSVRHNLPAQRLDTNKSLEREEYFTMQIAEAFKGKTIVITGGTGSFASTRLRYVR